MRQVYKITALSKDHILVACSFTADEYHDDTELLEFKGGGWSRRSGAGSLVSLARIDEGSGPLAVVLVEPFRAVVTPALARRETIADPPRNAFGRMMGGSLNSIRQIGSHIYVCGDGGQFYRRDPVGQWGMLDETLLIPFRPYVGEKTFLALNGSDENEIYLAHDEGCSFWNGKTLTKIEGSGKKITDIFVETPSSIWLCGWHGLVMHGNHVDGFRVVARDPRDQVFVSLCKYEDAVYLGSVGGFDMLRAGRIVPAGPVRAAGHPYRVSAGVETIDDVLWAVGETDVLRYEGKTWIEVPFDPSWVDAPPHKWAG